MRSENEQLAQQLVESQLAAKSLLTQKREELEKQRDTELKKIRAEMLDRKEQEADNLDLIDVQMEVQE